MYIDRNKYNIIIARLCLTDAEVADGSHMTKVNLSRILRGGKTTPSTVGHIAKFLGVDVTELLADEE